MHNASEKISHIDPVLNCLMFRWLAKVFSLRSQPERGNVVSLVKSNYLKPFRAGDIVLVRGVLRPDRVNLSSPLQHGKDIKTPFGALPHEKIIGQPSRIKIDIGGQKVLITHPTYEEYMIYRKRHAQPIYPLDSALIVALADIHVDVIEPDDEPAHFLEAGTGHGSLTLSICKAIHCANPVGQPRGAILHSIDKNSTHIKTGYRNIRDFRRGMYLRDVEFHVEESPRAWLEKNPVQLSGAFLDIPEAAPEIERIGQALKADAPLMIFCPHITQVQCLERMVSSASTRILTLINVVEIMPGMGGSLREWDVRTSIIKKTGEKVSICRPRVGSRVVGGGFVAMFRRISGDTSEILEANENETKNINETNEKKAETTTDGKIPRI